MNVFPKELPGQPPERQVEFVINLLDKGLFISIFFHGSSIIVC